LRLSIWGDETHLDTFLGFLEVDDVPNGVQVLQSPEKHHARREAQGDRKIGRRAGSMDEDEGTASVSGHAKFFPGSDDDEERRWTKRHGGINGARLTSGLTFLYCK
jgi:hypothetical protein